MPDFNPALDNALFQSIILADRGVASSLLDTSYGGSEITEDEKERIAESVEPLFATDDVHLDFARRIQLGRIVANQALQRVGATGLPDPLDSRPPQPGPSPLGRWAENVAMGLHNGPEALTDAENIRAMERITRSAPAYADNVDRTESGRKHADSARAGLFILISKLQRYPDEPVANEWLAKAEEAYATLDEALR